MCIVNFMDELLKPKSNVHGQAGYDPAIFARVLGVLNDMNGEAAPDCSPIYEIKDRMLVCIYDGDINQICKEEDIDSYAFTPIGVRVYHKDPRHEYILGFVIQRNQEKYGVY